MELTDRSGYFAGPAMLGGSFGDASRASVEAAEGVADPCLTHEPDQVVFYELTRKFVETEEDVPEEACDVLYYTLAVGHHTGVLDCFEPRLSVPVDVFYSLVDALPEGEARTKFEAISSFGECQLDKAAVPSLLEACDTLLDERGFRGSAKAGISVFDDDFGMHAQQVAFLMKFRDLVERVRDVSGVYLTGEAAVMGRVVDGRVNGAPFAGIVLTAGSVLRADDAAGPVLSKKMEDAPLAGWYTIDGGQTPEDDIIEVKRERPPRLVLVDAADMALPVGSIRLLDKTDVARKSMFTTHSLPLSILIEEIEQSCDDIVFVGIQPGDTEFYNPMSPEVFDAVDAVYDAVAANDFSRFVRLGQEP